MQFQAANFSMREKIILGIDRAGRSKAAAGKKGRELESHQNRLGHGQAGQSSIGQGNTQQISWGSFPLRLSEVVGRLACLKVRAWQWDRCWVSQKLTIWLFVLCIHLPDFLHALLISEPIFYSITHILSYNLFWTFLVYSFNIFTAAC